MEEKLKKIRDSINWNNIMEINIGYDNCKKYYFEKGNKKFILKMFSKNQLEKKLNEYNILKIINNINILKPEPITFEKIVENTYYYILSWVDGITLTEFAIKNDEKALYDVGLKIGNTMSKIHKNKYSNINLEDKIIKMVNKIKNFENINFDYKNLILEYLKSNLIFLQNQPKSIIHGDLNQDNIIICKNNNIGIIDFGNANIDYSYRDTHQIQMYNRFLSESLSTGIINQYIADFDEYDKKIFWKSYKIYSAYYCLSKIEWANKLNDIKIIEEIKKRSMQTVLDFDYFKSDIPNWYLNYNKNS